MKEMAVVAALAVFASLTSALAEESLPGSETLRVRCKENGTVEPEGDVKITVKETTLTLTCPNNYKAEPAPEIKKTDQKVFKSDSCTTMVPLKDYCSGATGEIVTEDSALQLYFPTVPSGLDGFYLKCAPPPHQRGGDQVEGDQEVGDQECKVHVLVQSKTQPGDNGSSNGGGTQQEGSGQGGGPAGVQTCLPKNKTITIRVPEEGSSAQFACESGSILYPTESNKIFSKDCKTQETLKDMTRTHTTDATSVRDGAAAPSYTLKADKKPAKKTLCYLCATAGTSPGAPGTAENYCTI